MQRWFVVHTQTYQEPGAESHLCWQAFEVWLPLYNVCPLSFRSIGSDHSWPTINGTFGLVRLFCNGYTPLAVLGEILQRRDEAGRIILPPRRLVFGDIVKVTKAPFADLFQTMFIVSSGLLRGAGKCPAQRIGGVKFGTSA